jgi:NAD(P)-dependent dehydrogenase (short-subunit alcohol dehydrogenase family)
LTLDSNVSQPKRVLITGSTAGIGLAAARSLADKGCEVIVHGPDPAQADAAAQDIRSGRSGARVESIAADLHSQEAVRHLAGTIVERFGTLDILVNNAAAVFDERTTNGDGIELTFAVNYVAAYLLTRLLLPTLERSEHGRIVTVGSEAHRQVTLDLGDLQLIDGYERFDAYARSKLADILFSYELSRRIEQQNVAVLTMHPGTTKTALFRPRNPIERFAMPIINLRAQSSRQGADTLVWLATDDSAPDLHGLYLAQRRVVESSVESRDPVTAARLWDATAELTGLDP